MASNLTKSIIDRTKCVAKILGDPYFFAKSRNELHALLSRYPGSDSASILAIIKHYKGDGWYRRLSAYQVDSELSRLIDWANTVRPEVVVEIGTANGATLLAWCRVAGEIVISVDLPGGIHGGGYAQQKQRLYRELVSGREGVEVELVQADSQVMATREIVEQRLKGRPVDILFIDGDHRYSGVSRDFDLWRGLVRKGGYVIFHDILPNPRPVQSEVDRFWTEVKDRYESFEIVEDRNQGWAGIGVLHMRG